VDDEALEHLLVERWLYRGLMLGSSCSRPSSSAIWVRAVSTARPTRPSVIVAVGVALAAAAVAFVLRQTTQIHRESEGAPPRAARAGLEWVALSVGDLPHARAVSDADGLRDFQRRPSLLTKTRAGAALIPLSAKRNHRGSRSPPKSSGTR